jgi:hypothetical protein
MARRTKSGTDPVQAVGACGMRYVRPIHPNASRRVTIFVGPLLFPSHYPLLLGQQVLTYFSFRLFPPTRLFVHTQVPDPSPSAVGEPSLDLASLGRLLLPLLE